MNTDINNMECSICLNDIHELNKVQCSVCKSGVYHRECLGFWFYKKELVNLRRSVENRKKITHICTICKSSWDKKESKRISNVY